MVRCGGQHSKGGVGLRSSDVVRVAVVSLRLRLQGRRFEAQAKKGSSALHHYKYLAALPGALRPAAISGLPKGGSTIGRFPEGGVSRCKNSPHHHQFPHSDQRLDDDQRRTTTTTKRRQRPLLYGPLTILFTPDCHPPKGRDNVVCPPSASSPFPSITNPLPPQQTHSQRPSLDPLPMLYAPPTLTPLPSLPYPQLPTHIPPPRPEMVRLHRVPHRDPKARAPRGARDDVCVQEVQKVLPQGPEGV